MAALTQRPDLFAATTARVPVVDLLRFNQGAGTTWIGEYGDPTKPSDRIFLKKLSPLETLSKKKNYPPTLIITRSNDDIVNPFHGRKMAYALSKNAKAKVFYFEAEGGSHFGRSHQASVAETKALIFTFFSSILGHPNE